MDERQYAQILNMQIREKQEKKLSERPQRFAINQNLPLTLQQKKLRLQQKMELEFYNPFGKGGSGAPLRDSSGEVITNRRPNISTISYVEDARQSTDMPNLDNNNEIGNSYISQQLNKSFRYNKSGVQPETKQKVSQFFKNGGRNILKMQNSDQKQQNFKRKQKEEYKKYLQEQIVETQNRRLKQKKRRQDEELAQVHKYNQYIDRQIKREKDNKNPLSKVDKQQIKINDSNRKSSKGEHSKKNQIPNKEKDQLIELQSLEKKIKQIRQEFIHQREYFQLQIQKIKLENEKARLQKENRRDQIKKVQEAIKQKLDESPKKYSFSTEKPNSKNTTRSPVKSFKLDNYYKLSSRYKDSRSGYRSFQQRKKPQINPERSNFEKINESNQEVQYYKPKDFGQSKHQSNQKNVQDNKIFKNPSLIDEEIRKQMESLLRDERYINDKRAYSNRRYNKNYKQFK